MLRKAPADKLIYIIILAALVLAALAFYKIDVIGRAGNKLDADFVYDVSRQAEASSQNLLYKESKPPIPTGFKISRAIAADSQNRIYVAGDSAIRVFSANGQPIKEIDTNDQPRCLVISSDNTIFVGFKNAVEAYDSNGTVIGSWLHDHKNALLTSIAVSGNNVFVADASNRLVARYDRRGRLLNIIGRKDAGRNIQGFSIPSPYFDLAVAGNGLLRVVNPGNHRIEAYTFDGDLEFWWGKYSSDVEGFCGCCNPVNFAIINDGRFVTCEKGLTRVKIYDAEGNFLGLVAGPEQLIPSGHASACLMPDECQSGGFDVAADNEKRILVLDTLQNVVRVFEEKVNN